MLHEQSEMRAQKRFVKSCGFSDLVEEQVTTSLTKKEALSSSMSNQGYEQSKHPIPRFVPSCWRFVIPGST